VPAFDTFFQERLWGLHIWPQVIVEIGQFYRDHEEIIEKYRIIHLIFCPARLQNVSIHGQRSLT